MTAVPRGAARAIDPERRAVLVHELVGLSERMLTEAEASRWEAVIERERQRQRVAWALFASPLDDAEGRRLRPDLERVLTISRRLTELARADREAVATDLLKMRQGRQGQRAYARWARS